MGQKLQDGKKVICVSLNSPYSERPHGKTACFSNLPFWILGSHYRANIHSNFHTSRTIWRVPKMEVKFWKNCKTLRSKNLGFLHYPISNMLTWLGMIIGSWETICGPWGTGTYIGRRPRYDGRRPRYDGRWPQNVQNIPLFLIQVVVN